MGPRPSAPAESTMCFARMFPLRIALLWVTFSLSALAQREFPTSAAKLSLDDQMSLMKGICPGEPHVDGGIVACNDCPKYLPAFQTPWSLGDVYLGHFTSPTAENALMIGGLRGRSTF